MGCVAHFLDDITGFIGEFYWGLDVVDLSALHQVQEPKNKRGSQQE